MATTDKTQGAVAFNFETSLAELETIVANMERGELTLEDSLQAFERGIALTRGCQTALAQAEQKVNVLMQDAQGRVVDQPFNKES
ncbi:MAG: exodeoxyribonuclease VII small subunit [Oceanospirillaceae bacterium]|jgi:exodeoxyribonuclease VII small subunit|nr:exodeoxyribonuclease VII small subunit [Oceanospirillaceae bacterium]MBT4443926.1 exodeoxyribonuclease VII small subunit [Oceanospirillaceae bacterium]MBT6078328.1 exodeoxyribonuclease VII small subunit [Oceanospirillaceae bacterium]